MKRWHKILLGISALSGGTLMATTPPRLDYDPPASNDIDLPVLIHDAEPGLIPGTEKRLTWHDEEQATNWSVVALHGFSATRQETAPLAELVADSLDANLFETRFQGHGLEENALVGVKAEQWLDDAAAALAVGRQIGNRVIVIGVSTGATMAMALLDHPEMQAVDAIILLSPNFAPADPKGMWITLPGGPLLLRLIAGTTRSWEAHNAEQELYWTTSYPTEALVQVIRTVDRANEKLLLADAPRTQFFYSPDDQVVSVDAITSAFSRIRSVQKEMIPINETGAPSAHIVAGDIISPKNTQAVAERIVDFILHPGSGGRPE